MYWCSTSVKRYCCILDIWCRRKGRAWENFNCLWPLGSKLFKWIRLGCDRKNVISWSSWNGKFQTWIPTAIEMEGVLAMWWESFSYTRLFELFVFFSLRWCTGFSRTWIFVSLDSWLTLKHPQLLPSSFNCERNSYWGLCIKSLKWKKYWGNNLNWIH